MTKTKMPLASKLYMTLIIIFLYAPIFVLVLYSFNASESTSVFSGFSLRWYESLLHDTESIKALYNTLILAISSSAISTVIGTAAAVGIHSLKNKWVKSAALSVTNIPMMNPDIVTGISMMLLFVFVGKLLGIVNVLGFWTMLIAHVTFNLPYIILSVMPKLKQIDRHLPEAAMDLGCTPVKAFFKVILPGIMPGVISGMIMAFTLSLDDFVISYFTTGPSFQTLPIRIFSMTKKRVTPDMYALSTIIFAVVFILLLCVNIAQNRSEKNEVKEAAK